MKNVEGSFFAHLIKEPYKGAFVKELFKEPCKGALYPTNGAE